MKLRGLGHVSAALDTIINGDVLFAQFRQRNERERRRVGRPPNAILLKEGILLAQGAKM